MGVAYEGRVARWGGGMAAIVFAATGLGACGGTEEEGTGQGSPAAEASQDAQPEPMDDSPAPNTSIIDDGAGGATTAPTLAKECARNTHEAERAKINLHLVVDISGSMRSLISPEVSRWHAVRDAVAEFIASPESTGIDLALSYYPLQEPRKVCSAHDECSPGTPCHLQVCLVELAYGDPVYCEPDEFHAAPELNPYRCTRSLELEDGSIVEPRCIEPGFCRDAPTEFCLIDDQCPVGPCDVATGRGICAGANICDPMAYQEPAVEKQALPGAAMSLLDSLSITEPDEFARTPTQVALVGSYEHTKQWLADEPGARSFVVLATDGFPDGCEQQDALGRPLESAPDAAVAVIASAAEQDLDTFVIGVVDDRVDTLGEARAQLAKMAEAGGTEEALVVTADATVAEGFLSALDKIRGGLPCEYHVPEPTQGATNLELVNVEILAGADSELAPRVASAADCAPGERAWHYEPSPDGASKIVLCEETCEEVQSTEGARVDVVLGCQTIIRVK